ncbi:MAG TPA: PAS domain-containing protein, partial [Methanobacterium sp.]|nr:PAS domain-containing protein [Methanobacterium sp.]
MEELSNTERLILSYIKSHSPEECMLDKITRGTSRSRATVLKYLDILHAKGILSYKFVGRSKLWYLSPDAEAETEIIIENTKKEVKDSNELASIASKLHSLISNEIDLKKSIDKTDTIVFTINNEMDIIATNDTFQTFFKDTKTLKELLNGKQKITIENALKSIKFKEKKSIELDLMEKQGIYRPYYITIQPILDRKNNIIGTSLIGEEISQSKRSKRDLETLLAIVQATDSSENEEKVMNEIKNMVKTLIPYKYFAMFLRDGKTITYHYKTDHQISKMMNGKLPSYINSFIEKSMDSMDTVTAKEGDYYLETIKSNLNDNSISMAISIPIIDEENARGAILLLTALNY